MSAEPETLVRWRAFLDRPLSAQRAQADASLIREDAAYGALEGLTVLRDHSYFPGSLYFRGEQPVLAYVEAPTDRAGDMTAEALLAWVGDDIEWLRSRAGKLSRLRVAAPRGTAVSEQMGSQVDFIELFPPTTFDDYRERLYTDPPEFIR